MFPAMVKSVSTWNSWLVLLLRVYDVSWETVPVRGNFWLKKFIWCRKSGSRMKMIKSGQLPVQNDRTLSRYSDFAPSHWLTILRRVTIYCPCYYGAVLPKRRPHYVSMLSVCLSVCPPVPCLLLFTYRFRYVSLNSYGKRNSHSKDREIASQQPFG